MVFICALFATLLLPISAIAQDSSAASMSSNAMIYAVWIAICCALVLLMQAGFLMLEGGMVRSKNAINVILKNFTDIGAGTFGFWLIGYGLMFGANASGWIGTSLFAVSYNETSSTLELLYQIMFAATAATIFSGAVAERFSFIPYVIGAFLVTTFVYPIFGSWAWGGSGENLGWLHALGFHDAAGATVVHSIGGWCALGALLVIGPRFGRYSRKGEKHDIPGHNLPFVAIGGFILWFGWFGFNGGAASDDFSDLGKILLNTHLAAVGGILGSILWLSIMRRGFYMTLIVNGALGGLVSVTAGCNVFSPVTSILVAIVAGVMVVTTSDFLNRYRIDDVVGAVPVHGFCGAWGTIAVGLFFHGDMFNIDRIIAQFIGVIVAFVWGISTSFIIFWALNKVLPIRVSTKFEQRGLDITEHKEIGYNDFVVTQIKADK